MHVHLHYNLAPPWSEMTPLRVGSVPPGLPTPDAYLTVEDNRGPRLRVDVYGDGDSASPFTASQVWLGLVALGYGDCLYLVRITEKTAAVIELGSYFGYLYPADEYLLVASGERLFRIQPDGEMLWISDQLGIDGVVVEEVTDGVITGSGEWDPPGGWQPFRLSLETGQPIYE